MFALIIALAFLWFAFIAPLKVLILTIIVGLIVSTTVRVTANMVAGIRPTHLEALQAVGLSLVFVAIAVFTMFSFTVGAPAAPLSIAMISAPVVILGPFIGYTLGFKLALRVGVVQSAIIAVASTGLTVALIFGLNKVFPLV